MKKRNNHVINYESKQDRKPSVTYPNNDASSAAALTKGQNHSTQNTWYCREREFIPGCNCTQLKLVLNTGAFGTHGNNYCVIKLLQRVLLQYDRNTEVVVLGKQKQNKSLGCEKLHHHFWRVSLFSAEPARKNRRKVPGFHHWYSKFFCDVKISFCCWC